MNALKADISPQDLPRPSRRQGIAAAVGNTPMLRLSRLEEALGIPEGVELHAKAEWFNPSGSVKDRAALYIVRDGERRGLLAPGKTILDATSGNTGIAYAMLGASLGYPVEICLPATAGPERKRLLSLYGADVVETPAALGTDGAIEEARRRYAARPGRYFYADQYNNEANWKAHYYGTAPEIWRQSGGRVTHFVAVVGTSGTFVGVTRRLKELNPDLVAVEVQPSTAFHGLEGMKHMPTALVPGIYRPNLAGMLLPVETEDAQAMTRALARYEGVLVGPSAGAGVLAAVRVALGLQRGVVVTVLPDGGSRYLSETFWDERDDSLPGPLKSVENTVE